MGFSIVFKHSAASSLGWTVPFDCQLNAISKTSSAAGWLLTADPDSVFTDYSAPSSSAVDQQTFYVAASNQVNNTGLKIFLPTGAKVYSVAASAMSVLCCFEAIPTAV